MTRTVCPRCGFIQDHGEECFRCGLIFERFQNRRYRPSKDVVLTPPSSLRSRLFRIVRWAALAVALLSIALIFWRPRTPQSANPEAVSSAEAKVMEHQRLADAGQPHTLELDQPELNGWLETHLDFAQDGTVQANSRSPQVSVFDEEVKPVRSSVRDVKVELQEDSLRAYVVFDFHGVELTMVLAGRLFAQDGYLRFQPVSGKLGRLPLPQASLQSAMQRLFDAPENKEKFRLPVQVEDIGIRQGKLYLKSR